MTRTEATPCRWHCKSQSPDEKKMVICLLAAVISVVAAVCYRSNRVFSELSTQCRPNQSAKIADNVDAVSLNC